MSKSVVDAVDEPAAEAPAGVVEPFTPAAEAELLEGVGPGGTLVLPGDAERVGRYLDAAHAAATHRAYAADADAFAIWCARRGAVALPAAPETIAAYLTALADAGAKPASITRRASGIGWVHAQAGHGRPTEHAGVRAVLRGIRRDAATRGVRTTKACALTPAQLRALVEDLPDTLAGARDRVVILVGYALALRASDLVGLDVRDLNTVGEGLDVYVARSKTDQDGAGETLALAPGVRAATCPVTAVHTWLARSHLLEGPLLRRVDKSDHIAPGSGSMATSSVRRILTRAATRAGISSDQLSPHSLRRGFATAAYRAGVPEAEIARTGRWKSVTVMRGYDDATRWTAPASGRLGL